MIAFAHEREHAALDEARARTLELVSPLDDDAWCAWPDPDFSPIAWHLGHLAFTQASWVLERLLGDDRLSRPFARRYAQDGRPKHERAEGFEREATLRYLDEVRDALRVAWRKLDRRHDLVREGYLVWFLACHEHQHRETIAIVRAATVATTPAPPLAPVEAELAPPRTLEFPTTRVRIGTDAYASYDNERPSLEVEVPAFAIASRPVCVGEWLAFVHDDGYRRDELWCDAGRRWREARGIRRPSSWGDTALATPRGWRPLDPRLPVHGVSAFEADAFARWCGARLPTEDEWELAARSNPQPVDPPTYAPVVARNAHFLGGVWEWTSSAFAARPGFRAFPYRGYSEPWFGDHRVMRGGSFATDPAIATPSFRNFYVPETRACFVGLRLAWDR
ncbi:MAG: ergothioneine biosynthesis protein EgtB [Sandaracinus sp.]|nr:ergothioneine biosynthesis protein EgtB [Sandaracinus sp.]